MQKATINSVAAYAGVSKKTVSRVLNNEPNVSVKTTQKVNDAFKALAYKPSPQARGLASNQSFLIGLIYDNPNKDYIHEIQMGALNVCNDEGYHLVIHPAVFKSENILQNLKDFIIQSQLDGLVLTPPFSDMHSLLEILEKNDIAHVRIAATEQISDSICVINNDQEASYEITDYIISLGHRDIGFIKGHPEHNVSAQRFKGFEQALIDHGLEVKSQYIEQGYFDFVSGVSCANKLLNLDSPPTAIFASNDYMAAGVLKAASLKKIKVPDDLSITGFDDVAISRYLWPSITTIQQPVRLMASKALDILIKQIRKQTIEQPQIQLASQLLIRESCAELSAKC
ncbi:MAG: transcriptional regulator [Gammaproteobacteria bacterium]|nr:MAG: transcriptional regulator [Gammaproteobacteria bacterium]